jgi:hypothetical protein
VLHTCSIIVLLNKIRFWTLSDTTRSTRQLPFNIFVSHLEFNKMILRTTTQAKHLVMMLKTRFGVLTHVVTLRVLYLPLSPLAGSGEWRSDGKQESREGRGTQAIWHLCWSARQGLKRPYFWDGGSRNLKDGLLEAVKLRACFEFTFLNFRTLNFRANKAPNKCYKVSSKF